MAWYPDRPYRTPITSQNAKVLEAITNGYIDLSEFPSAGLHAHAKNGGGDIRITKADGETEVAREIVTCDTTAETGEIHFDTDGILTGSDVLWYLYYGDPAASDYAEDDPYGREAVWDANYLAVYHLLEAAGVALDSTSNDKDGTFAGNLPDSVAAKLGNGQDFDGTDDYISIGPADPGLGYTISCWMNSDANNYNGSMVGGSTNKYSPHIGVLAAGNIAAVSHPSNSYVTYAYSGSTWYYVTYVVNDKNNKLYINNALEDESNEANSPGTWDATHYIGVRGPIELDFNGIIDEVRFYDGIRSLNWITTMYNNQNDPSTFWSIGAEETIFTPQVIAI